MWAEANYWQNNRIWERMCSYIQRYFTGRVFQHIRPRKYIKSRHPMCHLLLINHRLVPNTLSYFHQEWKNIVQHPYKHLQSLILRPWSLFRIRLVLSRPLQTTTCFLWCSWSLSSPLALHYHSKLRLLMSFLWQLIRHSSRNVFYLLVIVRYYSTSFF